MTARIDAHHHLWRYNPEEYAWIGPGMEAIARDFLPSELEAELASGRMEGAVAVQARQSMEETDWLLDLAAASPVIRGVVGWAPILAPEFAEILEKLKGARKLKGLRHIVQAEPDDEFVLRKDFNAGIAMLDGSGLVYDILIYERHLPAAIRFVDRHPNQVFVLDHLAKPRIKERSVEPWKAGLAALAKRENVYCKLSGLVTEADWRNWTKDQLRPYTEAALEAFGPARLMFGSDWPVCLLACSYREWSRAAEELLARLSASEKELVFGGVVSKVYSLESAEQPAPSAPQE
ncbi:MAG TPA: amidohydrolase family protein [Candidatus Acidoferrum sp.]|nr:amidohydrolase family protein [Candidatus Acidoferrum sp.]